MEIYERSRQRNHSHNVSASSSLAWAHRSVGAGGMASTHGVPNQESKINCALPIAFSSPCHNRPNGSASKIRQREFGDLPMIEQARAHPDNLRKWPG
jgi:hypothetical protein